jgi:hypothetical protein
LGKPGLGLVYPLFVLYNEKNTNSVFFYCFFKQFIICSKWPSLSVFPNPATTEITINTGNTKGYQFVIFNALGQIIWQQQLNSTINTINIWNFKQGLYFYRITDKAAEVYHGKFIKE